MGAGLRGGPRIEWAEPKQEEFEGRGYCRNGNTQDREKGAGISKESQRKEFGLRKEVGKGRGTSSDPRLSEKWSPNFARGIPLNPVLSSPPQEATSTISPRPCTSKCVEGIVLVPCLGWRCPAALSDDLGTPVPRR